MNYKNVIIENEQGQFEFDFETLAALTNDEFISYVKDELQGETIVNADFRHINIGLSSDYFVRLTVETKRYIYMFNFRNALKRNSYYMEKLSISSIEFMGYKK